MFVLSPFDDTAAPGVRPRFLHARLPFFEPIASTKKKKNSRCTLTTFSLCVCVCVFVYVFLTLFARRTVHDIFHCTSTAVLYSLHNDLSTIPCSTKQTSTHRGFCDTSSFLFFCRTPYGRQLYREFTAASNWFPNPNDFPMAAGNGSNYGTVYRVPYCEWAAAFTYRPVVTRVDGAYRTVHYLLPSPSRATPP